MKKKAKPIIKPAPKKKETEAIKKTKIRVVGIGGGGGNIVSEIASKVTKVSFLAANTDRQALKATSKKLIRFQFGESFTRGLGTGMNAELAREAALQEKEKIKKLLENQDLCILISCLGGGTGSGASPIFAKISKNLGNITLGIFTLPFKFEGEKKMELARESLKKVKNYLNAIIIIPNERVFQIIKKETPLKEAFSTINKSLADGLAGLIETIFQPGLINIDFADLKTVFEGQGRFTYLNCLEAKRKEAAVEELITKTLSSPLYPYSIKGGKGVLFNISGEKELSLAEVNQISKTIAELVNPEAKIIFGISQNKKHSNTIKVTLLVTGCGLRNFSPKLKKKKRKKKIIIEKPKVIPKEKKLSKKKKPKRKKIKIETAEESEETIRKNALQIKKEAEELEKEMLAKEQFWESPAFLRKKKIFGV